MSKTMQYPTIEQDEMVRYLHDVDMGKHRVKS